MKELLEHAETGAWPTQLSGSCRMWPRAACLQCQHCWHFLQKDSTGSSLPLIPTLSSKEVKNLWAHSDTWNRAGSQFPRAKGWVCFISRMCAWITPKWDKTNYAKCIRIEMKAAVSHGFPCSWWSEVSLRLVCNEHPSPWRPLPAQILGDQLSQPIPLTYCQLFWTEVSVKF